MIKKSTLLVLLFLFNAAGTVQAQTDAVKEIIDSNYDYLADLYKHFHEHPELSQQEEQTSTRLAKELRQLGFSVTEGVGGHGVVGVYENGEGPNILVRSDMDALPINEQTGVDFASTKVVTNKDGEDTPVMHACGHDMHMAVMAGTAGVLTEMKDQWQGTLIFIGQPAEELFSGARAMIGDGLFERFPEPDYMLALHVGSSRAAGKVGMASGYAYANVDMGEIIVKGRGGHGAYPNLTVDPVVIASKLVLDLQTLISREIAATDMANISIGSIRGGTAANIIPDEVVMDIALNVHSEETRKKLLNRIREMCEGAGRAAGLPEEDWPELKLNKDTRVSSVYNDPELVSDLRGTFNELLGEENVQKTQPSMYGEDFGEYNHAKPDIPGVIFGLGSIDPEVIKSRSPSEIPSTHSPKYIPDLEPTLRTGILSMSSAVLDLLRENGD
ncbi:hippurate hydrolase [Fodinibius roseus]|uniref:Hippurate hydrolase n=1 Tax=Fodinibius roseus TaxID=1194090 RepID=A0A1M5JK77_9BACT|nr:amidohydrolase [Fodinibius roseus]SHG40928.1 hippurate hydrolase [Fodinibius roseus]